MAEKLVYDYSKEERVEEGDLGEIKTTTTIPSEEGEWPKCLGDKNVFLSSEFSVVRDCSCEDKKHTVYCVVAPEKIWPDKPLILIRVIEKQ